MKKRLAGLTLIAFALSLAGCGNNYKQVDLNLHYVNDDSAPVPVSDKNAQNQLAETANSINQSLQQLAAIQIATHPDAPVPEEMNPGTLGMGQKTSIDWTGPVEPLLQKIAAASQYRLRVIGKEPTIPVIVTINATDEMLADVLRDVTYQINQKAAVHLYPTDRIIELRYKEV